MSVQVHSGQIAFSTPLKFADAAEEFKQFSADYLIHKKGYFILAPSGVGKTHYMDRQEEKHWVDGDRLWEATNAHPEGAWWTEPIEIIVEIDQRCDVITAQAIRLGFWIMGASNSWLQPDAIVIPDWEDHVAMIKHREENNYDGGATSDRLEQVKGHRDWILKWEEKGVPRFKSVSEATTYIETEYQKYLASFG